MQQDDTNIEKTRKTNCAELRDAEPNGDRYGYNGWWHPEFNEMGGYDCMTGAWDVYQTSKGRKLFSIDQANFGQKNCDYNFRSQEAEALVREIVGAHNAKINPFATIPHFRSAKAGNRET